ncbi:MULTISPECIES: DNA adenine methylase [unclassified Gilliamella]|uniref:DNA adenine methylase n=1 Tax=unclassified Gilliamella TaxID=2685620 RepID=UPI002269A3C6|nr:MULTISPECIES: hypothetical protein [unclassified Gilliamella]MCX8588443.1 DNA adenine methylase [Gilliamella sp. B3801]MCX8591281.1 DNA adenine methylase [Gilliamella sp. B3804]
MPKIKSPLRYPGGKSQLASFVANLIDINNLKNCTYIEPFSGGAGIAIELLLTNQVKRIVLNDYDKSIYSIWYSILNHTDKLISLIENTPITIDSWYEQKNIHEKNKNFRNSLLNGFSTLFLNRTNRSGIINAGPTGGYNQKGNYKLDCRFNKVDIINKIISIAEEKNRIDLYQKDALALIRIINEKYSAKNSFIFFDPPYFIQGNKLYTNFYHEKDHFDLAKAITNLNNYYWITTYDYTEKIYDIYSKYPELQKFQYQLSYSAQNKIKATEYLFASPKIRINSYSKIILTRCKI